MSVEQAKIDMSVEMDKLEVKLSRSKKWIEERINNVELLDGDGYPTTEALDIIREWTFQMSDRELFEFIESIWWMPDWGWEEGLEPHGREKDEEVYRYRISTGGWSGNEDIIQAMFENKYMFWHLHWVQSRCGGHYIFELRKEYE